MNRALLSNRALVIYTLPAFVLFLAVLLMLGFLALTVSIEVGLHIGDTLLHANPFAAYEALWPGQPATNLAVYVQRRPEGDRGCVSSPLSAGHFTNLNQFEGASWHLFCENPPKDDQIRAIHVVVSNDQIYLLSLFSAQLQQEDLLLYWGAPDAIRLVDNHTRLELSWERSTYSAVASVEASDEVVKVITLVVKD